jgi:adenine-specific DNA glycosylase
VREAAVVVRRGGRALVMRRPRGARWAGMFDFPRVILDQQNGRPLVPFLVAEIHALTGIRVEAPQKIGQIRHSVTRFRIRVDCYEARIAEPPSQAKGSRARRVAESTPRSAAQENGGDERLLRWVTAPQLRKLPMSVPARRLAELAFRRS